MYIDLYALNNPANYKAYSTLPVFDIPSISINQTDL